MGKGWISAGRKVRGGRRHSAPTRAYLGGMSPTLGRK